MIGDSLKYFLIIKYLVALKRLLEISLKLSLVDPVTEFIFVKLKTMIQLHIFEYYIINLTCIDNIFKYWTQKLAN